jgi:hypothetical protein
MSRSSFKTFFWAKAAETVTIKTVVNFMPGSIHHVQHIPVQIERMLHKSRNLSGRFGQPKILCPACNRSSVPLSSSPQPDRYTIWDIPTPASGNQTALLRPQDFYTGFFWVIFLYSFFWVILSCYLYRSCTEDYPHSWYRNEQALTILRLKMTHACNLRTTSLTKHNFTTKLNIKNIVRRSSDVFVTVHYLCH